MELLSYLLKVNIAIVMLYALYIIVFQRDTLFVIKRAILLFFIVFVVAYPLVNVLKNWFNLLNNNEIYTLNLNAIIIATSTQNMEKTLTFSEIVAMALKYLYFTGIAFFTVKFIVQITSILRIIFSAKKVKINGMKIYVSERTQSPFSFFRIIVIDHATYSSTEIDEILLHEQTHVKQWHSVDVLMSEILCAFTWFNPATWLLRKEIRLNLEYVADNAVVANGCDATHYQLNLLQLSYQKNLTSITNNFNVSPLKKRIIMMKKTATTRKGMFKYALLLPVITCLTAFNANVSATDGNESPTNEPMEIGNVNPTDSTENVFVTVEELPEFPGGQQELYKYIGNNLRYPPTAQENGVQGRIVLRFIVEKDGSISDVQILHGFDIDCDKEALRVIKSLPKFIPGKQNGKAVRVYYTIPITFALQTQEATQSQEIENALIMLDGKVISKAEMDKLDPNAIERMDVYKGEDAVQFGEKGKNGVIVITSKKENSQNAATEVSKLPKSTDKDSDYKDIF